MPFPVGKHDYHFSFEVDRRIVQKLDCDPGPPKVGQVCSNSPLLDVEWKIWDGTTEVKAYHFARAQASAWSANMTSCMLGVFEGRRNALFTLEWNVKKDGGSLKTLIHASRS